MALSNTATPKYYGRFRDAVMKGEIPVCEMISLEMNRIDDLIANPGIWYDDKAIDGFIAYCEEELTLTDGADLRLLDTTESRWTWRALCQKKCETPAYQQAVSNRCQRCGQVNVCFLHPELFPEYRHLDNTPDYDSPYNETGG